MKKQLKYQNIIYVLGLILAVICAIAVWFLPMYKFDSKKINKYSTEYLAGFISNNIYNYRDQHEYSTLTEEGKVKYNSDYFKINQMVYSVINNNEDKYYDACAFDVLNQIGNNIDQDFNLTIDSSSELIKNAENICKNNLGNDEFNNQKNNIIEQDIKKYNDAIYDKICELYSISTKEDYELVLYQVGVVDITHELFDAYYDCDDELVSLIRDDFMKKGIKISTIFNAWDNVNKRNEKIETSSTYANLSGNELKEALLIDNDYYQTGSLKVLTVFFVYVFITLLITIIYMIFRIKSLNLPKWIDILFKVLFIIQSVIILFMILSSVILPESLLFTYHQVQVSRFIQCIFYTTPSMLMYLVLICNGFGIAASFIKNKQ